MVPSGAKPDHPVVKPVIIAVGLVLLALSLVPVWIAVPLGLLAGYGWLRIAKGMPYSEENTLGLLLIAILVVLNAVALPAKQDYELRKAFRGLTERMLDTKQQIQKRCAEGKLLPTTVDLLGSPAVVHNVSKAILEVGQGGAWKVTIVFPDVFINPFGVWEYVAVSAGSELTFNGTCAARRSTWRIDRTRGVSRPQAFLPSELRG